MAKTFTPIVGLAVVMALALAAVFGSMSLANPAMAAIGQPADAELTERVDSPQVAPMNLAQTYATAAQSVVLTWDAQDTYVVADYQVRWKEADSSWISGQWVDNTNASVVVSATTGTDANMAVITATGATEGNPELENGTLYDFQVRIRKADTNHPPSSIQASPSAAPSTGAIAITSLAVDDAKPGEVVVIFTTTNATDATDATFSKWQYRYITNTLVAGTDTANAAMTWPTGDTEMEGDWTDFDAGAVTGVPAGPFTGTIEDLESKPYRFQVRAVHGMTVTTSDAAVAFPAGTDDPVQTDGAVTTATNADFVAVMPAPVPFSDYGRAMVDDMPETGVGQVTLEWEDVDEATHFSVQATRTVAGTRHTDVQHMQMPIVNALEKIVNDVKSRRYTVTDLMGGVEYSFIVRLYKVVGDATETSTSEPVTATPEVVPAATPVDPELEPDSYEPGENTRYVVTFSPMADITTGVHDITIELEDFDVPSSISESAITVSVRGHYNDDGILGGAGATMRTVTNNPADVVVDGEKVVITLKVASDDFVNSVAMNSEVTIVLKQAAGISNPSEGGRYGLDANDDEDEDVLVTVDGQDDQRFPGIVVLRTFGLDPDEGGRGDMVTATGKGFKNGTSLLVFLDENEDNVQNNGEDTLCTAIIGGDDVGSCEFEITNPPFGPGNNRVSAVDGRSQYPSTDEWDTFALDPSMSATPSEGTPGDAILVQLSDFSPGNVKRVRVARQDYCNDAASKTAPFGSCDWNVGATGEVNFQITVPDWAPTGKIDLRVDVDPTAAGVDDQDASLLLTISGPSVSSTPAEVIANQRVSLVGDGFNNGATIKEITIGGEVINPSRINGGQTVHVDNGGGWSASVNLPLSEATASEGVRQVRVTDSMDRVGTVPVTVKSRTVTITPDTGRVGTIAVVRGEGFPSRNDEGSSFNVEIIYDAGDGETTVSAQPNAGGIFETQLRIPTTADIPSTNTVRVTFDTNLANGRRGGPPVITTVSHDVPEGAIFLSETSGASGSMITVTGEGFKAYVPVQEVHVGSIEVTPSPTPSTDAQGMLEFEILIPGLEDGIQTIEVQVSGTTASRGFTVTPSGVASGGIVGVANGVEPLGDNVVSVWNFNNDTKVWSFYDPTLAEGNTLTHLISGETYLVRIESNAEVILNNETRNLTCVADNCWNQIVW